MSDDWYARPILFVADIDEASAFYTGKLGFTEPWRHVEDGRPLVAQVERNGCELLLSCQWPELVGSGKMFISLDPDAFNALQAGCAANNVDAKPGQWGYELLVVTDPSGNQLYFPHPDSGAPTSNS